MPSALEAIPGLRLIPQAKLSEYTRFALGGPAKLLADASTEAALVQAVSFLEEAAQPWTLIGGGSNLVVSDQGCHGTVLRYVGNSVEIRGKRVTADSGVILQTLVDQTIAAGLQGLETMTGIPGWLGGAVYGNAGAYGHSIQERVTEVRFFDGHIVRVFNNSQCKFAYRESLFKQRKDWVILSATLELTPADPAQLKATADGILKIRNEKYPPTLKCAGSIFKNLLWAELSPEVQARVPEKVVREGKVPSAYFLEQVGAKGITLGGIHVADYHANLIYNDGQGTALEVAQVIDLLKRRVREAYGLTLEEEVQYISSAV